MQTFAGTSHDKGAEKVLVDYWYAAISGDAEANIGNLATLAVPGSNWDQSKMVVAKDAGTERVYIVGNNADA